MMSVITYYTLIVMTSEIPILIASFEAYDSCSRENCLCFNNPSLSNYVDVVRQFQLSMRKHDFCTCAQHHYCEIFTKDENQN